MWYYTISVNITVSDIIAFVKLGIYSRKHKTPSKTFHENPFSVSGIVIADRPTKERAWIIGANLQPFIAIAPKIQIKYDLDCD